MMNNPASIMVAEFLTPDNKRYDYEQINIFDGLKITIQNETEHKVRLSFHQYRQSDKEYPIHKGESDKHIKNQFSKVHHIKNALMRLVT